MIESVDSSQLSINDDTFVPSFVSLFKPILLIILDPLKASPSNLNLPDPVSLLENGSVVLLKN